MTYKITLLPSKKEFSADDSTTLLDAALQAKINLPHSCRNGDCGTCKAKLLVGKTEQTDASIGLSAEEKALGYILTCVTKPKSDVEIESGYCPELDGIDPVLMPCKVNSIEFPSVDIAIIKLRLPPNQRLVYLPGQYIDLMWKGMQRSYSIANSSATGEHIELHVRHVPNGIFSKLLFEDLKPETLLRLNGPHGTFFTRNGTEPIIFLAGGTGFAPVKAMVEELLANQTARNIFIYWGVRSTDSLYSDIPRLWAEKFQNIIFVPVVSNSDDSWQGRTGLVHEAVLSDFSDLREFHVYACGAPALINVARKEFIKQGLAEKNFYSDAFTPFKSTN